MQHNDSYNDSSYSFVNNIITPEGEDYCSSLASEYVKEYRNNAKAVINRVAGWTERSIISAINKKSAEALRKGVAK